ncbi:MAG: mannosyltransferase family protein [Candidatus Bathyarchaeota archaeon]|nr:mannosyltransferase family protein [Candidatus Bathyarchaeota archaeon]
MRGSAVLQKLELAWMGIPYALKIALLVALVAKVAVFAVGYASAYAAAYSHAESTEPFSLFMNMFAKWDGPHYMFIAEHGYVNEGDPANFIVFFPLYPLLVRLVTFDFAYINLTGLLVSNVFSIAAAVYLFRLAKLDYCDDVAEKAVLFLFVFPTAYFLSAVFTESLFLTLVIASLYYARGGRWGFAGVLGLLASLTRLAGVLMLLVLAVEYLHQKEWKPKAADLRLLWAGLPVLGFFVYLLINYAVTGGFFTFMDIQRTHWYETFDPLAGLVQALNWPSHSTFPDSLTVGYAQVIFAGLGLFMVLAGYFSKLRPSYQVYMLSNWMLAVSISFWLSIPRYVLTMFPMFLVLALVSKKKSVTLGIVASSLAWLIVFTWLFASGAWAF